MDIYYFKINKFLKNSKIISFCLYYKSNRFMSFRIPRSNEVVVSGCIVAIFTIKKSKNLNSIKIYIIKNLLYNNIIKFILIKIRLTHIELQYN